MGHDRFNTAEFHYSRPEIIDQTRVLMGAFLVLQISSSRDKAE